MTLKQWSENTLMNTEMQPEPSVSVESVKAMLSCTEKGYIKRTRDNCRIIFDNDPLLRRAFRYNLLTDQVNVTEDTGWDRTEHSEALTDSDLRRLYLYMEQNYNQNNDKYIDEALFNAAEDNRYHPIREYLLSLQWDGEHRIGDVLHHFLGVEKTEFSQESMRLFLLGAIARVFTPGRKFDYMLCIIGPQGCGKSTFLKKLSMNDEWFSDDIRDIDKGGKVYEQLRGHWIIEMSEMLAMMNMKCNESIKAFVSREKDNFRLPYAKNAEDRPRQCVFAGTTNRTNFLPDDKTGNRRFLPVECNTEDIEVDISADEDYTRAYMEQVWAEAMHIWNTEKPKLVLSRDMQKEQKKILMVFTQEDTDEGLILSFFENYTGDRICSKMIYKEALNHMDEPKKYQTNDICETVNQLILRGDLNGWRYFSSPRSFGSDYGKQRGWERIPDGNKDGNEAGKENDGFIPVPEQMVLPFVD